MLNAAALLNTAPTFVGLTMFSRTAMRERGADASSIEDATGSSGLVIEQRMPPVKWYPVIFSITSEGAR